VWYDSITTKKESLGSFMKDRFTDLAFEIIRNATTLAGESGSGETGSEYILLALTSNPKTRERFKSVGITEENLAQLISTAFPPAVKKDSSPGYTKEARDIFEKTIFHSVNMSSKNTPGQKTVATTDFLTLAILRDTNSRAHRCLEMLAVDVSALEGITLASISSNNGMEPTAAQGKPVRQSSPNDIRTSTPPARTKTSTLEQFATNFSQAARDGKLDPVVGRSKEIERILQILARRTKNNPVLVGEPGVGKSAIIEGLAQELLTNPGIPENMRERDVWSLDMGSLIAGTKYRGDFEQRLKKLVEEIQASKVIIFIDEIHSLVGAGGGEGSLNAANILKPVLARGEMQTIGATTYDEYRKHFEKDAAMARRFQQVDINEPSTAEAIQILKGIRSEYEKHHNIKLTDASIEAAVTLSARYINDRFLPDKAIDLMDEAGARAKINRLTMPPAVKILEAELADVVKLKEAAIETEDFLDAAAHRKAEDDLKARIVEERKEASNGDEPTVITEVEIAAVLTASTGIPVTLLTDDSKRLMTMEKELAARVIGQEAAIKAISRTVRRQRAGLKDPKRPAGSFIFAGPTGVGKTELAKALADFLFHDETSLITLDMSEYGEKHTVSRLFGAPPGFVGYEEGGQLTERVRRKPYSVILFDEIEKAHPDIFNSLLQVLEEGRLTDGQGRMVDFKNTIILMTTNIGARQLTTSPVGFQMFGDASASYENMKNKVFTELKKEFKPEFLNRLDDVVVFPHLATEELVQIIDVFTASLNSRLVSNNLTVNLTEAAKRHIVSVGYDETLGARPLRRAMQQLVEDAISEMLLFRIVEAGTEIAVDFVDDKLTFNGSTREQLAAPTEMLEA
jgi:ATP-dependent Clp protease ATP-binding subunit ClpC